MRRVVRGRAGFRFLSLIQFVLAFGLVGRGALAADSPSGADAREVRPDSAAYRLEEVRVTAPRPLTTVGGASGIEAEVSTLPVPVAPTLENVLRTLPLLHVRTNSRGESEISARGSESRQVALLVDGVPITLAWDARADASVIPATAPREVIYLRGLSSMLYGPNVLGGIIEMSVANIAGQPAARSFQLTTGADDNGAFGASAQGEVPVAGLPGQTLVRGGVGYRTSPGQPLAKGVAEPVPVEDGLRLNTDAENVDGFIALRHRTDGGAFVAFSGTGYRANRGIAAELGVADEDARLWRYPHVSRGLAVLSTGTGPRVSPLGGTANLEAGIGYDRGKTDIDQYLSRDYRERIGFENGKDRTLTLRLRGDHTLSSRGELRGAFTLADIRHEETLGSIDQGVTETDQATYRQRLWSLGGETEWLLRGNRGEGTSLTGTLGGAYDVGSTPESGGREPLGRISEWGGRAGLSLGLDGGRTTLHTGISRRGRFPALRELYSGALGRFAPNPDLKPEKLVAAEAGITRRLGQGSVQAVAFHHRLKDAVVRITLPDRRFMRVNRNELKSTGGEFLGSFPLGPVALAGDFTWQDVKLTDTQAEQTHRPENLPETFGSLSAIFPILWQAVGGARVDYTGVQSSIDPATGEDTELAATAQWGVFLARTWRPGGMGAFSSLEARVSLDNLTDVALYDAAGLPGAGRRVRMEVRVY